LKNDPEKLSHLSPSAIVAENDESGGQEMLKMTEKDRIRRLVLVEGKSIRQVAKETGRSRNTITKMLADSEVPRYQLTAGKPTPALGPFKSLIDGWIALIFWAIMPR
jgi:hypothetical protein